MFLRRLQRSSPSASGWWRFFRSERGTSIIEFALLAPIFFALIGATLETSVVFLTSQIMESAVQDAGRAVRTGQAQRRGDNLEKFRGEVCSRMLGLLDCSQLHIEVSAVSNFKTATVIPPIDWNCTKSCSWTRPEHYDPGQGSSTILVQVYYKYPLVLTSGFLGIGMADLPDGKRLLGTATVFKNEPFLT
jgi:Flp pilus assembly protein TadG